MRDCVRDLVLKFFSKDRQTCQSALAAAAEYLQWDLRGYADSFAVLAQPKLFSVPPNNADITAIIDGVRQLLDCLDIDPPVRHTAIWAITQSIRPEVFLPIVKLIKEADDLPVFCTTYHVLEVISAFVNDRDFVLKHRQEFADIAKLIEPLKDDHNRDFILAALNPMHT